LPSVLILNSILLKIYFQDFVVFPVYLLLTCVILSFFLVDSTTLIFCFSHESLNEGLTHTHGTGIETVLPLENRLMSSIALPYQSNKAFCKSADLVLQRHSYMLHH